MKKLSIVLCVILAFGILGVNVAGLVVNASAGRQLAETNHTVSNLQNGLHTLQTDMTEFRADVTSFHDTILQQNQTDEDPGQEDDVLIAGSYTIRSTSAVSDAYLSGDRSALDDKQKETLDMASSILGEIITDGMTDYEKEKAVYEWMTTHLTHDSGLLTVIPETQADCDNPYGVLKYHNAVCVGYATTFRLFMQMLEIPCKVVHNSECYHSWDLVNLNGSWYHTDIYSDVGSASYAHFNMTDTMQGQNQSWNREYFPPADSTEYCYVCMGAVDEDDIYHVPAAMREAMNERKNLLSLRFGSSLDENQAQVVQQMLSNIQDRMYYSSEFNNTYMDWSWLPISDGYVLAVNFQWSSDEPVEPDAEITEEQYQKLEKAVEDAFGDLTENYDPDDWDSDEYYRNDDCGLNAVG